jgi:hypothetical protein
MKRWATLLATLFTIAFLSPAFCQPFAPLGTFVAKTDGTIVYATDWNTSIGNLYTYITTVLLPQLNVVQNTGDMYVMNGTALARLGVGTNGQILTADNTQPLNLNWENAPTLPLTTQGDMLVMGPPASRLPIGPNGYVLTADSTQPFGLNWENPPSNNAPSGTIIMFYGTTIPSGWFLCDGTNGTPNLIGMFPVGAQPSGGMSTPNPSGFGNAIVGTTYGTTTHNHSVTVAGTTGYESVDVTAGIGTSVPRPGQQHTHSFSVTTNTTTVSNQPASLGLVFIQKQ